MFYIKCLFKGLNTTLKKNYCSAEINDSGLFVPKI